MYRTRNRGKVPANAADLRTYADKLLERTDASSFDELLSSERDGQALTLRFGRDAIQTADGVNIIGYESHGKDGKRLVAYDGGYVIDVDEAAFAELVPTP